MKEKKQMGSIDQKIDGALRKYGYLTHKEVGKLLGVEPQKVTALKNNNQILGIKFNTYTYYLSPQFSLSNQSFPVFIQTLNTLKDIPHMKKLFFFIEKQKLLNNDSPMEALMKSNGLTTILNLAKEYAQNN